MELETLKNLIAKELGLEGAPPEEMEEIIMQVGQSIMERTTLAIIKRLTLDEQEEFSSIAETGDYQKAYEFASSKIENFDDFVKAETLAEIEELKK